MAISERITLIREQIAHMEEENKDFRRIVSPSPRREILWEKVYEQNRKFEAGAHYADHPPLPPRLPRPQYSTTGNLISTENESLSFFAACQAGDLDQVKAFIEEHSPGEAILQYALEQASFSYQPDLARYLLGLGTPLHSCIFERYEPTRETFPGARRNKVVNIFHGNVDQDSLFRLISVFLDFGWHPNQAWSQQCGNWAKVALTQRNCVANRPLVELLLARGADPNLGNTILIFPNTMHPVVTLPHERRCGHVLNTAIQLNDISLVDLILAHGAVPAYAHMLHSIATYEGDDPWGKKLPFSQRQPLAEHLLALGLVDVNEVKKVHNREFGFVGTNITEVDATPLSHACAARDWKFAEWLLERGADPHALDDLALKPQWWHPRSTDLAETFSPYDPSILPSLIEKVRNSQEEQ